MDRERDPSRGGGGTSSVRRSSVSVASSQPFPDAEMYASSASRDEGLRESSAAWHDDLSTATRAGVTGMERTPPERVVSRRLSASEKTPARSFYHRSFYQGSLGMAFFFFLLSHHALMLM